MSSFRASPRKFFFPSAASLPGLAQPFYQYKLQANLAWQLQNSENPHDEPQGSFQVCTDVSRGKVVASDDVRTAREDNCTTAVS